MKSRPLSLAILFAVSLCRPSEFLVKEYAVYNFNDEGFLTPDLLQTIGSAPTLRNELSGERADRLCLAHALDEARSKALRVLVHTHFRLTPKRVETGKTELDKDYSFPMTERDLIHAELGFADLMQQGFVAMQDARPAERCKVVFRIMLENLPFRVRDRQLGFEPENLKFQNERISRTNIFRPTTKNDTEQKKKP